MINAVNKFKTETDTLLKLLESISENEMNQVPFKGSWTAAQVGDHLYKSYAIKGLLLGKVSDTERPMDAQVETLNKVFLNFEAKYDSPESTLPSVENISKESLLKNLRYRRDKICEIGNEKDLSKICLESKIPGQDVMTRYEWIYFCSIHTLRHNRQITNIIKKL